MSALPGALALPVLRVAWNSWGSALAPPLLRGRARDRARLAARLEGNDVVALLAAALEDRPHAARAPLEPARRRPSSWLSASAIAWSDSPWSRSWSTRASMASCSRGSAFRPLPSFARSLRTISSWRTSSRPSAVEVSSSGSSATSAIPRSSSLPSRVSSCGREPASRLTSAHHERARLLRVEALQRVPHAGPLQHVVAVGLHVAHHPEELELPALAQTLDPGELLVQLRLALRDRGGTVT